MHVDLTHTDLVVGPEPILESPMRYLHTSWWSNGSPRARLEILHEAGFDFQTGRCESIDLLQLPRTRASHQLRLFQIHYRRCSASTERVHCSLCARRNRDGHHSWTRRILNKTMKYKCSSSSFAAAILAGLHPSMSLCQWSKRGGPYIGVFIIHQGRVRKAQDFATTRFYNKSRSMQALPC